MSYFKSVYVTDSAGNNIEVETVDNNKYFGTTVLQDVHISLTNENYAGIGATAAAAVGPGENKNLTSGGTFTGTSQNTLGFASAQINIAADQNCTIYIDQSMDNINWDITDSFTYYYSAGGNSWTSQMTGSYVRIRVTNNGASSTTYFRLQTAMCPIVEAVPRSLSSKGNFKTSINELLGTFGTQVQSTPMGDLKVSNHVRLVGTTFTGTTFDTNFWTLTSTTGGGTATLANGAITLATGTPTANGSAVVNSVRVARYVGGTANYYRGVVRAPTVTGTNVRRWGAYDANDGFFFSHDGTTLSLTCRKTGSDTNTVPSGSFNGEQGTTYVLNTVAHTYEVVWTNSSAWFIIDGAIIHKFSGSSATLTDTPTLKVGMECVNSGGNTNNNSLVLRTATISRLGELVTESIYKNITTAATTVCKYGSGRLHKIIVNDVDTPASGLVTIYDNTSGTGTTIGAIFVKKSTSNNTTQPFELNYNVAFSTGLTIVTAQAGNITVIYE